MLKEFASGKMVTHIPHKREFDYWKRQLSSQEYNAIINELNQRVATDRIHTSSWIPGSNWEGTPFQPIYEKACKSNDVSAGLFFGLILWKVMQDRPEVWFFGRFEKDGHPIKGITYFLPQDES